MSGIRGVRYIDENGNEVLTGGLKTAATNKAKYGDGFYSNIGTKGGRNGYSLEIDSRQAVSLGEYTLFDDGEILSKDKKIMMPQKDAKGYLRIRLRYGDVDKYGAATYKIHRLVAENFIANPEKKPQVNHKNGDKTDNRVQNLEWVTNAENMNHAIETGLLDNTSNQMNKLGGQIRTAIETGYVIKDIAEKNGIAERTIRRRVYDFEPEPITTLKVGRIRTYFYYDQSRKKYRVEANDRIPEGRQFNTKEEAQTYVNQFYKVGGFAANPELARLVGKKGGKKSRRGAKNETRVKLQNMHSELVQWVEEGKPYIQIAKKTGLPVSAISKYIREEIGREDV